MSARGKRKDEEDHASEGDVPPSKTFKKDSDDTDEIVVCEVFHFLPPSVFTACTFLSTLQFPFSYCRFQRTVGLWSGTGKERLSSIFVSFMSKMASRCLERKVYPIILFFFFSLYLAMDELAFRFSLQLCGSSSFFYFFFFLRVYVSF